jgi:hypothetical protein
MATKKVLRALERVFAAAGRALKYTPSTPAIISAEGRPADPCLSASLRVS